MDILQFNEKKENNLCFDFWKKKSERKVVE